MHPSSATSARASSSREGDQTKLALTEANCAEEQRHKTHKIASSCLTCSQTEKFFPTISRDIDANKWTFAWLSTSFLAGTTVGLVNMLYRYVVHEEELCSNTLGMEILSLAMTVTASGWAAHRFVKNCHEQKQVDTLHSDLQQMQQLSFAPIPLGPRAIFRLMALSQEGNCAALVYDMSFVQQLYALEAMGYEKAKRLLSFHFLFKLGQVVALATAHPMQATALLNDPNLQRECQSDPVFRWAIYELIVDKDLHLCSHLRPIFVPHSAICENNKRAIAIHFNGGKKSLTMDKRLAQFQRGYIKELLANNQRFPGDEETLCTLLQFWDGRRHSWDDELLIDMLELSIALKGEDSVAELEWQLMESASLTLPLMSSLVQQPSAAQLFSGQTTNAEYRILCKVYSLFTQAQAREALPNLWKVFQALCLNVKIDIDNYLLLQEMANALDLRHLTSNCQQFEQSYLNLMKCNFDWHMRGGVRLEDLQKRHPPHAWNIFASRTPLTPINVYALFMLVQSSSLKERCREFCQAQHTEVVFSLFGHHLTSLFATSLRDSLVEGLKHSPLTAEVIQKKIRQVDHLYNFVRVVEEYLIQAITQENLTAMWTLSQHADHKPLEMACVAFSIHYNLPLSSVDNSSSAYVTAA